MTVPQNLIDEFYKGHGVVFVGAGLSKGAGLPDWKELMRPLALEIPCSPDLEPTKIAQYYVNKHRGAGRHSLVQQIERALVKPGIAPTPNHAWLAKLPAQIFFTTNFDDLLERALAPRAISARRQGNCRRVGSPPPIRNRRLSQVKIGSSRFAPRK